MQQKYSDRIVVYRSEVLPLSETFIPAQLRSMKRYQPHLVGLKRAAGPPPEGLWFHTLQNGSRTRIGELLFKYLGHAPSLRRTVKHLGASMVHAHFATDASECLPLVQTLKLPLVVTLHGWDVTTPDQTFLQTRGGRRFVSRRKRLQEYASVFLCVSKFIYQEALQRGFPAEKLRVHYIGVDTEHLTPAPAEGREKVVLFVGRLVRQKGLSHLLRAMAALGPDTSGVKLVVIGDGPSRPEYEAEARALDLSCDFLGAQPNGVVHEWMRRSQMLVLPSVREALGMVICEAFALGLPVIGSASGGIPEAISEGCGLLTAEGDARDLAAKLTLLLRNSDLRERLAANAHRHVLQNFDLATQTAKLEQIYDEVRSGERQPGPQRHSSLSTLVTG